MKIKYIVIRQPDGDELLFTFPAAVEHLSMFQSVKTMRVGPDGRWTRPYSWAECVGAGFIMDRQCYGESESIGIKSRSDVDTALLRTGSET